MQKVGKYQPIRKIATGGMAEVYLAKAAGPMGFEKTLVLKRILPHLAQERAFVEMFLAEAMLAARLSHSHIAQIFDFGEADGAYFLAMEYIDGPSLRTLVKRSAAMNLPLPTTLCARIVSQACEGLAFAHDFTDPQTNRSLGLIHRDVSPDNILLSRQGSAKVVDFGIAKAADQAHITASGVIKGKLSYMPLEQLSAQPLDRRADVYALGVVLYELLTARKPFESTSDVGLMQAILFQDAVPAARYRLDLPESLRAILDRALAKDRAQRYPDCHALQSDLEEFILSVGKPVTAQQVAQLIQQVTASTEGAPGPQLQASPPAPVGLDASSDAVPTVFREQSADTRPGQETQTEQVTRPLRASGTRFLVAPPPSEPQSTPPPTTRGKKWRNVLGAAVLLGVGGGLIGKGRCAAERPESPPVAPRVEPTAPRVVPALSLLAASPSLPSPEPSHGDAATAAPAPALSETPKPSVAELPESKPPATPEPTAKESPHEPPQVKPAAKGKLNLRVHPFAAVYVDGKYVSDTPLAPITLPAGLHTITLSDVSDRRQVREQIVVEIKPNETQSLKVDLNE